MTRERDIERLMDAWFLDGPMQVADRVFEEAVERVERQHQRPAWRFLRRESHVTTPFKVVLGAAAIIVVFVAGFAMLARPGSQVGGVAEPTATPQASPSPTAPPSVLPDGLLEPGTYSARALPGDSMAFTISVPRGWTGFGGWTLSGPPGHGAPNGVGVAVLHAPQVVDDPCDPSGAAPSTAPIAPSVDDLVAALAARPDLVVSGVTDATLAGYQGRQLDVQLPAAFTCAQHYVFAEPQGFYSQGLANRWRVWIVDAAGETAVVVLTDFAGTPAGDRAAAQAIVDSLQITQ
jgi:hypothetical protein